MNSRQHLHLASQDASLWGEQCLHPRTVHNKRGGPHSVCIFTSTMPSDCLPSWAKSPAAINQGTSIYSGCSLSSVSELSGLSALKIRLGATNVCLLPGFVSAREKGSWEVDFCPRWVSAQPVCSYGGKAMGTDPMLPLWTEGRNEVVERWGVKGNLAQGYCLLN